MQRLTFMVCPHDTAKEPERWYRLVQYLAQHLSLNIQFDISLDFADFHEHLAAADMVYANPTDSLRLMRERGCLLLARPANSYDEAVLVANTDIPDPTLAAMQGLQLATVKSLIPTRIALRLLENQAIKPAGLLDKVSWQAVISSVWNREVDYGIVYKDTYDGLSAQGKGLVNVFAHSDERVAFHSLVIAPTLADRKDEVQNLLLAMHSDPQGQEVLNALHIAQWLPVTAEEIATMRYISENYV